MPEPALFVVHSQMYYTSYEPGYAVCHLATNDYSVQHSLQFQNEISELFLDARCARLDGPGRLDAIGRLSLRCLVAGVPSISLPMASTIR